MRDHRGPGYLSPTSVLQVNREFYLYYWGPSHVFPDRLPFTLQLSSDQDGELRLVAWNPAAQEWLELAPTPIHSGMLYSIAPLPTHAKRRLKFTPREGRATVSPWVVPQ
jgi:hypothetical protein